MIFWKCSNCETNNLYPKTVECECCGAKMNSDQTESAKRFMFYKQRADEGDSYAIMNMAEFYASGDVFIKDIDKALEMMTDAANRSNADAQQKLADWYFFEDNDFPSNDKLAFEWATKAYESGNLYSAEFLATCYLHGYGVTKNENKGIELLTEAANFGFSRPMEQIANYYNDGRYVEIDKQKAAQYYSRLCIDDNCLMETAYNAGFMYYDGKYIEQNYTKATEWFNYAIDRYSDLGSKIMIAKFHYNGLGCPQNKALGYRMMVEIAENKTDEWASNMANKHLAMWENKN